MKTKNEIENNLIKQAKSTDTVKVSIIIPVYNTEKYLPKMFRERAATDFA